MILIEGKDPIKGFNELQDLNNVVQVIEIVLSVVVVLFQERWCGILIVLVIVFLLENALISNKVVQRNLVWNEDEVIGIMFSSMHEGTYLKNIKEDI